MKREMKTPVRRAPRVGVTAHPLGDDHRAALLGVAFEMLERARTGGAAELPEAGDDPTLAQPAATFVTLSRGEARLGCVGTVVASEALVTSVARNAWSVAADPGLLTITDLAVMSITVSVLSPLAPIRARSWRDLRRGVRPGRDGLLVEAGDRRATLLPSAWEELRSPDQFLDVLWHKAGLRPRDWLPGTVVRRYSTEDFTGTAPRPSAPE